MLKSSLVGFSNTLRTLAYDFHNSDGQFRRAPSPKYVFDEGSGAVLFNLPHHMPQIMTTDDRWNLVLQMAAGIQPCKQHLAAVV